MSALRCDLHELSTGTREQMPIANIRIEDR